MPLSQDDVAIALVSLNDSTAQVPVSGGFSVISNPTQLGLLGMGVNPSGNAAFLTLNASNALEVAASSGIKVKGYDNIFASEVDLLCDSTGQLILANMSLLSGFSGPLPAYASLIGAKNLSGNLGLLSLDAVGRLDTSANIGGAAYSSYGTIRVTQEQAPIFLDPFDGPSINTVRWTQTASGSGATTQTDGTLQLSTGITASHYSIVQSNPVFFTDPNTLIVEFDVEITGSTSTGANRFWGLGQGGNNTTTNPITDGIGYELYTDGLLYATTYRNGVRTATNINSNKPTSGPFRYRLEVRPDYIHFMMNGQWYGSNATDADLRFAQTATFTASGSLPIRFHCINAVAPGTGARSFSVNNVSVAYAGQDVHQLSDGIYPHRKATIDANGALSVTGSLGLIGAITGSVSVLNTVNVTGSVRLSEVGTITGSVGISGIPTVTGSVSVLNAVNVTGSLRLSQTATVTGSVALSQVATVTGSITVPNTVTVTGSVGVSGLAFASGALAVFVSGTNTQSVTGSMTVANVVAITGSVALADSTTDASNGGALSSRGEMIMGADGAVARFLSVDATGKLNVNATAAGSPNVGGTGSLAPTSASLGGGIDGNGVLRSLLTDAGGRQVTLGVDPYHTTFFRGTTTGEALHSEFTPIGGGTFDGGNIGFGADQLFTTSGTGGTAWSLGDLTLTAGNGVATNSSFSISSATSYLGAARFLVFVSTIRVATVNETNNARRWGMLDASNGYFFELSSGTLKVGSRRNVTDTTVSSFNGVLGTSYTVNTSFHTYEIVANFNTAYFYVDGQLLHSLTATTATLVGNLGLPGAIWNVNSGGRTAITTINSTGIWVGVHGKTLQNYRPVSGSRGDSTYSPSAIAGGSNLPGSAMQLGGYESTLAQFAPIYSYDTSGVGSGPNALFVWDLAGSGGTQTVTGSVSVLNTQQVQIVDGVIPTRKVTVNPSGSIEVAINPTIAVNTYSATALNFVPAASPTDVFTIAGSASKTIRILRIEIYATRTTATGGTTMQLIKRSSANTGGTSTTSTAVGHDSTNAAVTAVVRSYTANPTALGTTVGVVRAAKAFIPAPATTPTNTPVIVWDFGNRPAQAIVLRGTAELLCLNLAAVTIAGNSFTVNCEWTEE